MTIDMSSAPTWLICVVALLVGIGLAVRWISPEVREWVSLMRGDPPLVKNPKKKQRR